MGVDRALVTTNPSNLGSRRGIEGNGGRLEVELDLDGSPEPILQ